MEYRNVKNKHKNQSEKDKDKELILSGTVVPKLKNKKQQTRYKDFRGARGVMVIVVGNGHGDTSSNPGRDWLHFT